MSPFQENITWSNINLSSTINKFQIFTNEPSGPVEFRVINSTSDEKRIKKNLKTQGDKRSKMRSTWEGFKSKKAVSDKEIDALIAEIQSRK